MASVKSYYSTDDFWFKYSDKTTHSEEEDDRKKWKWTKILKALKLFKKTTDLSDAAEAIETYSVEKFAKHFSYRKGNKMVTMKNPTHIARIYRKLKGHPRYWDYDEEEECQEVDLNGEE